MKRALLFYLLLILHSQLIGQTASLIPATHVYGIDQGLPSSEAHWVNQDPKGHLWVCTDRGVCKFNGYEFKTLTVGDGLTDNVVFESQFDSKDIQWFRCNNGTFFYIDSGLVKPAPFNDYISTESSSVTIHDFGIGENDTLWAFCTERNEKSTALILIKYHHSSSFFKSYSSQDFPPKPILLVDIGNGNQISAFNPAFIHSNNCSIERRGSFLGIDKNCLGLKTIDLLSRRTLRANLISKDHWLVGIDKKLYEVKNGIVYEPIVLEYPIASLHLQASTLYVGTLGGGVQQFSISSKKLQFVKTLLVNYSVSNIFTDQNKNLWFSTLNNGLLFQPKSGIEQFHSDANAFNQISRMEAWPNGFVALSNHNTILSFKPWQDQFQLDKYSFNKDYIYTFIITKDDQAFALSSKQIPIIDLHTGALIPKKNQAPHNICVKLIGDTFLFILGGKVLIKSIDGKYVQKIKSPHFRATAAYFNKDKGTTLIGTYNKGVFQILGDTAVPWFPNLPFSHQRISSFSGTDNLIVVGTIGNGLYLVNHSGEVTKHFSRHNGLQSNLVSSALVLENTQLAVGSNSGLQFVDLTKKQAFGTVYNRQTGLLSNEVLSLLNWHNGLLIGTAKGINYIDLDPIITPSLSPKLQVDSVIAMGKKISASSNISIKENKGGITFYFTGIDFSQNGQIEYSYKLSSNETWTRTRNRSLHFESLPYGSYELALATVDPSTNKIQLDTKLSISFTITRPFYKKTLVILLFSLVFAGIVVLLSLNYVRINKKQGRLGQQLIESEQKALKAQMNPHFLFNAMNSVQNFIALNDKKSAFSFISKFSTLVRTFLENSDKKFISLQEETAAIRAYLDLEKMRFDNKFNYSIYLDNNALRQRQEIQIPGMIIQPILENAILHGIRPMEGKGQIAINVVLDRQYCIFSITDNGIGRKKSAELNKQKKNYHKSMAIKNIDRRIELLSNLLKKSILFETIDIDDNGQTGTLVILKFPLKEPDI